MGSRRVENNCDTFMRLYNSCRWTNEKPANVFNVTSAHLVSSPGYYLTAVYLLAISAKNAADIESV